MSSLQGYLHPGYAQSLSEFGEPRLLSKSQAHVLVRRIPGSPASDAMGCYPLFACQNWSALEDDLQAVQDLVCLSVVCDPFGDYNEDLLRSCFPDVCFAYKDHFIVELDRSYRARISAHHRRYARKALKCIQVECVGQPDCLLDTWIELYEELIARHHIRGISAFSREAFAMQLQVPGMVALCARHAGEPVGMLLWYAVGKVGYYHLGAFNSQGYALHASFALFWRSFEVLAQMGVRWLNLGGGAGAAPGMGDGLADFKKGWSAYSRKVYFCGRVFQPDRYAQLSSASGHPANGYFPAYRRGEFA